MRDFCEIIGIVALFVAGVIVLAIGVEAVLGHYEHMEKYHSSAASQQETE